MSLTLPARPTIRRLYPHVGEVGDPFAQQTIRLLWDRVHDLEERLQQQEAATTQLIATANTSTLAITAAATRAAEALALSQAALAPAPIETSPEVLPGGGDGGKAAEGFAAAGPTGHDSGGLLTPVRAGQIVGGTAHEFSGLLAPATEAQRAANQLELLLRMIWHLRTAGFSAGRQRNPSGVVSSDKLTVVVDSVLRAYDVFTGPPASDPLVAQMREVGPPVMVDEAGTPD